MPGFGARCQRCNLSRRSKLAHQLSYLITTLEGQSGRSKRGSAQFRPGSVSDWQCGPIWVTGRIRRADELSGGVFDSELWFFGTRNFCLHREFRQITTLRMVV
jgi:hypothetical protein